MSSYFFAQLNITNKEQFRRYEERFQTIFAQYNGQIKIVDEKPIVLEGEWSSSRIVLIHFPSKKDLEKWYYSAEYQELVQIRKQAANGTVLILTDLEEIINGKT